MFAGKATPLKMPETSILPPQRRYFAPVLPSIRHSNTGKRVQEKWGDPGIGGLGHVAIKIAKAMGAHVVVLTTSQSKAEDAHRLGAHESVLSSDAEQMAKFAGKLDLILDTVSAKHDVNSYLKLLKIDGSVVLVGLPP